MTHNSNSCKTCDWCGELEPESGLWERRGRRLSTETVLCNNCNPYEDVDHGAFVVYSFTMDTENETIQELISNWIEASGINTEWKVIKDTGLDVSTDGHTRCKLVVEMKDGLTHYQLRNLQSLKSVVDAANGDPQRNNAMAKVYNYDVGKEVLQMKDPEVFAASEGHSDFQCNCEDDDTATYQEKLDKIRDSYELAKAKKDKLDEDFHPHIPLAGGADALRKARTDIEHRREKKLKEAKTSWEHAARIASNQSLQSVIENELVDEVSKVIDEHV